MVLNGLINLLTSQSALHVKLTNLATDLLKQKVNERAILILTFALPAYKSVNQLQSCKGLKASWVS